MSEPAVEVESAEGPRLFPYLPTEPIEGDHIYVSTFALAWRKLRGLAGGEVRVEGAPAWLDAVAGSAISEADVPPKTLVTVAGFGPPAVEGVRREMEATFGAAAPPPALPDLAPDGLLVFAHLQVGLEFEKPFQLEKEVGLLFGDVRVKHFRCPSLQPDRWDIAKQVVVHHYSCKDDFVVELLAKSHEMRLLIVRTPGRTSLAERAEHALERAGRDRPNGPVGMEQSLLSQDTFSIPLVRVKEARRYHELVGRRIGGVRDLGEIGTAVQDVKLLLDERGVKLISTFTVATKNIRPPAPRAPYDIICDGPFLLIVIGNGSTEPLAVAAVETPRWLIPISEPDDVPAAEDPEIQEYSPEVEALLKQFDQ
jgi:hypothetical protein